MENSVLQSHWPRFKGSVATRGNWTALFLDHAAQWGSLGLISSSGLPGHFVPTPLTAFMALHDNCLLIILHPFPPNFEPWAPWGVRLSLHPPALNLSQWPVSGLEHTSVQERLIEWKSGLTTCVKKVQLIEVWQCPRLRIIMVIVIISTEFWLCARLPVTTCF